MRNGNGCQCAIGDASSFWPRLACAVILGGACLASATLSAAPISFHFDATITTVFPGIPFESGISFGSGEIVSGQFTFDPNPGDGSMSLTFPQAYEFSLKVSGTTLSTPQFNIQSINNSPVSDYPFASTIDELELGGNGLARSSDSATHISPANSGFRLSLWAAISFLPGDNDVFQSASIPAGVQVWNRFTLQRTLSVSLGDGAGGAIGFQANVGDFQIVPEPESRGLILFSMIWLFVRNSPALRT